MTCCAPTNDMLREVPTISFAIPALETRPQISIDPFKDSDGGENCMTEVEVRCFIAVQA